MKQRLLYFDTLRAFAIIGVIFIHVNAQFYKDIEKFSIQFDLNIILRQVANFAVPLFLFISGFFMANKTLNNLNEYKKYLSKSLPRILIPFFVWTALYSFLSLLHGENIIGIIKKAVTFQASGPFYFIFLIIQYYTLQPLIIILSKTKKGVLLSFLTSVSICALIEFLRYKRNIDINIVLYAGNFLSWIVFPVVGVYVKNNPLKIRPAILLVFTVVFLLVSIFHSFYLSVNYGKFTDAVTAVKASSFIYSLFLILFLYSIKEKLTTNNYIVEIVEIPEMLTPYRAY